MSRRTAVLTTGLVLAAMAIAVVTTAAVLLHQRSETRPTASTGRPATPVRVATPSAEQTFLDATAAHLCSVQSMVYADPKALADAYQATPEYPGLTPAQVERFRQRLTADATFARALTSATQRACGSATPAK
ncbi:hypothetical protein [Planosporangium mesophilum]|uniref:Uncharacterized protein n=1 Tax=Planosporangium mesophilum TaxID=689768 RepID=A0A8J3TP24_9ACTN|nr:hypothetical protein [Planosporangium mesophilum]NJC85726.1 hypothetical protein [Planosporangium mesophilum]GII24810.1 hypothetical protein Pme01_44070 [Planosporangium mesophilum]